MLKQIEGSQAVALFVVLKLFAPIRFHLRRILWKVWETWFAKERSIPVNLLMLKVNSPR